MSSYTTAVKILKKCLEIFDESMVDEIRSIIEDELEQTCKNCKEKFNLLPKQIKDLSGEIDFDEDTAKLYYDKLLSEGLFFVYYPYLTGEWEIDRQEFYELHSNEKR